MLSGDEGGSAIIKAHNAFLERVRVSDRLPQDAAALQQRMSDGTLKRNVVILTQEATDEDAQAIKGSYMRLKAFMAGKEFKRLTEERAPGPTGAAPTGDGAVTTAAADVAALAVAAAGAGPDGVVDRDGEEDRDDALLLGAKAGRKKHQELAEKANGLIKKIEQTWFEAMKTIASSMEETASKIHQSIEDNNVEAANQSLEHLSKLLSDFKGTYEQANADLTALREIQSVRFANKFVLTFVTYYDTTTAKYTGLIASFRSKIANKESESTKITDSLGSGARTEIDRELRDLQEQSESLTKDVAHFNKLIASLRDSVTNRNLMNSKNYMTDVYQAYLVFIAASNQLNHGCKQIDASRLDGTEQKIFDDICIRHSEQHSEVKYSYESILASFQAFQKRMSEDKADIVAKKASEELRDTEPPAAKFSHHKKETPQDIGTAVMESLDTRAAKVSTHKKIDTVEIASIFEPEKGQGPRSKSKHSKSPHPSQVRPKPAEPDIRELEFPNPSATHSDAAPRRSKRVVDAIKIPVTATYVTQPTHKPRPKTVGQGRKGGKFHKGMESSSEEEAEEIEEEEEKQEQDEGPETRLTRDLYLDIMGQNLAIHRDIEQLQDHAGVLYRRLKALSKETRRVLKLMQKHPFE